MNRLELVRQEVDSILLRLASDEDRRCGFVHLYGVSLMATWLAGRRGLDPELAATAGMLHDLATYATGSPADHATTSAHLAVEILDRSGAFSRSEIEAIAHAIARHRDKASVDGPMDELLKDADVLQHWSYNPALPAQAAHAERRKKLEQELTHSAELHLTAKHAEIGED